MKSILVFSNGEKIGDGLIKLPFLYEIKKRLPDTKIYWMTNEGTTVYNGRLKNIAYQYIDEIYEQVNLQPFFWQKISKKFEFENIRFDYILDTQKAVLRTIALKRINSNNFISSAAAGIFSTNKMPNKNKKRKYYLEDLFRLLDLIQPGKIYSDFKIQIPDKLIQKLDNLFNKRYNYIGYAPGAGEKNKIWNLDKFVEVAKYFENKHYKSVFFFGPQDITLRNKIKESFQYALFPEEKIEDFSGPEIVIACTQYLSCSLSNDSGVSHMLSTNMCPLIKLFGPKDSKKFTPSSAMIHTISSSDFDSKDINFIPVDNVIKMMNKALST